MQYFIKQEIINQGKENEKKFESENQKCMKCNKMIRMNHLNTAIFMNCRY